MQKHTDELMDGPPLRIKGMFGEPYDTVEEAEEAGRHIQIVSGLGIGIWLLVFALVAGTRIVRLYRSRSQALTPPNRGTAQRQITQSSASWVCTQCNSVWPSLRDREEPPDCPVCGSEQVRAATPTEHTRGR